MDPFAATITGALVSLVGVLLTLRWNQKLHEANLREERQKRRDEREFAAKQGALLSAAEAVNRFLAYYMTLPDKELPSDGTVPNEITEMGIALNRLHFYCTLETIEKSVQMSKILDEAYIKTLRAKMPAAFLSSAIKNSDLQISNLEKMNTTMQEEIKSLLQSDPNNSLVKYYREQISRNFHSIAELYEKRVHLIKQKYIETEKCRDVIINNLRAIYEAARDVLMIARKELSFGIDEVEYKKVMDSRIQFTEKSLKEFFKEIRKQVEDRIK